ncbi:sesquiterpene synthase 14b-like [Solanum verrucosum]|uniref:sesquiterpene synthase 14b-like n=1 Tax=Solanum verrucosum TaxID=315347 RepID=UPI0020D1EE4A|nr:sesquiterpene synthase 14b-like [Solanum verrucosum]
MVDSSITTSTTTKRPLVNYHSTIWGDFFLSYTPQLTEISSKEKHEHEELKEKVRQMLVESPDNSTQKLVLIDIIQRLGVEYHFKNDIETSIQNIFKESQQSKNDDDLYVVALRFRLVRQQRHYMSSDVFKRFTNDDGKFKEALTIDVQGLLSLYEAAHLRVHGEEILEEALTFTVTHLESMAPKLGNSLKAQVSEALSQPIHTNLPRFLARKNICMYENIESRNNLLLKFAKLDFNILQKVYQRELSELTIWWKNIDVANKFSYARDRLVECYFGAVGLHFEPQQSRARIMTGKILSILNIVDDTFDAYATFDELVLFTNAIERSCGISAMESVSHNLRPIYQVLIEFLNELEDELKKEGKSDRVYYAKVEMKKWIKSYFKEAEWLNACYFPKCEEYMENAITSIAVKLIATISLICLEELIISKETLEWVTSDSSIFRASSILSRLKDDIMGHHFEQQRTHIPSFFECYMKEHGVSKQEAYVEVQKIMENAWKDINTELLCPSQVPMFALEQAINPTRLTLSFQVNDFINTKGGFKDKVFSLLVDPIKI